MKDIMDTGFESIKDYTKNEFRSMKNDTDTKLQSMKNSMEAKFNSKFKSLLDKTDASTCIKSGNMSVSSGNVSTGNVSVTNDSTDNVSDLDDGAEATSNALEIRNDVKLCSLDSELNAAQMKNDARCDDTVSKMDDLENDPVKVENRVISVGFKDSKTFIWQRNTCILDNNPSIFHFMRSKPISYNMHWGKHCGHWTLIDLLYMEGQSMLQFINAFRKDKFATSGDPY